MAHLQWSEDEFGDTVDQRVYCSDFCAREDPDYGGWSGCHEISFSEPCAGCGTMVEGLDEE